MTTREPVQQNPKKQPNQQQQQQNPQKQPNQQNDHQQEHFRRQPK